jgi:hypothetical protein
MKNQFAFLLLVAAAALFAAGCAREADVASQAGGESGPEIASAETHDHDHADHDHAGHDHSGWWCVEHGIPEEECSMCSSEVAARLKEAGDWCEEHDRADSQCFLCHPDLKEKFAARYVAKYGKQPPEPIE